MKMELPDIGPDERTPLVETLLGVIRQLMDRVAELERAHQELRDEKYSSILARALSDARASVPSKFGFPMLAPLTSCV